MEKHDIVIYICVGYIIYNVFIRNDYRSNRNKIVLVILFIFVLNFKGIRTRWNILKPDEERKYIIPPLKLF